MVDGETLNRKGRAPASLASVMHTAREAAGLSIRQLALLVGAHHSVLARIELGEVTRPSPEMVQNIAQALELDVSELLEFIGVKATLPSPRVYFRRAYNLTPDEAEEAERQIEDLLDGLRNETKQRKQSHKKGGIGP